jgi:hypothetical protein
MSAPDTVIPNQPWRHPYHLLIQKDPGACATRARIQGSPGGFSDVFGVDAGS